MKLVWGNWLGKGLLGVLLAPNLAFCLDLGPSVPSLSALSALSLQDAYAQIEATPEIRALLHSVDNSFVPTQTVSSSNVQTVKFQHYYKGLEVVGSMSFQHSGLAGVEVHNQVASFDLNTQPTLSSDDAAALARSYSNDQDLAEAPELKILSNPSQNSARLIYSVKTRDTGLLPARTVIFDAQTGELIANVSDHAFITAPERQPQIHVVSAEGLGAGVDEAALLKNPQLLPPQDEHACQLYDEKSGDSIGVLPHQCTLEISNSQPVVRSVDDSAYRAMTNAQTVLAYYKIVQGRNSYDGNGADLVSAVHVGRHFSNSYWSLQGNYMAYGDGDGKIQGDFTQALDVAGHEMTHGVTEATAKLPMYGEGGAVNEANSDFFGIMINKMQSWVIGKQTFLSKGPGIRDLSNPRNLKADLPSSDGKSIVKVAYPAKMSEIRKAQNCNDDNDSCYIHFNSTITSHARYLVTMAIGPANAQSLYYHVLTQSLNPGTTIQSEASDTIAMCKQHFGPGSDICSKVVAAYAAVGI